MRDDQMEGKIGYIISHSITSNYDASVHFICRRGKRRMLAHWRPYHERVSLFSELSIFLKLFLYRNLSSASMSSPPANKKSTVRKAAF